MIWSRRRNTTWPTELERIGEMPHRVQDEGRFVILSSLPGAEEHLRRDMPVLAHQINEITGGNPEIERMVGGLLLTVTNRTFRAGLEMGRRDQTQA